MKTIIFILIALFSLIYLSGMTINFKPFEITFKTPYLAIGIIFFVIALSFFNYQSKKEGIKEGRKQVIELIKEIQKNNNL